MTGSTHPPAIENAVKNNILSFIDAARHSSSKEEIIKTVVGFYESQDILKAKETLFQIAQERAVSRRKCSTHSNPMLADIADIYDLFDKMDEKMPNKPEFLACGLNAYPPRNFELIADVICSLRDEVSALRLEIKQCRENSVRDAKTLEDVCKVKEDITDIKLKIFSSPEQVKTHSNRAESESSKPAHIGDVVKLAASDGDSNSCVDIIDNYAGAVMSQDQYKWQVVGEKNKRFSRGRNKISAPSQGGSVHSRQQGASDSFGTGKNDVQPKKQRININGTLKSPEGSLRGAERIFHLFLGGCAVDSSCQNIKDHCKSLSVDIKAVEEIPTKSKWHKPYKVSYRASDKNKVMDGAFWPTDCFVRPYFIRKVAESAVNVS